MIKKTITYEDFNGNQQTETFCFNLTKTELMELELGDNLSESIKKMVETNDKYAILKLIRKIILLAYGKKSDDGKRFIKNEELIEEFEQSAAYEALFDLLTNDETEATSFIEGVVPPQVMAEAKKMDNKELKKLTSK